MGALAAASIVSLASWVMIFSSTLASQADLILRACLVGGMASRALLPRLDWPIALSLAYGLIGVAPAGLIMALTGQAMAPNKSAPANAGLPACAGLRQGEDFISTYYRW